MNGANCAIERGEIFGSSAFNWDTKAARYVR